MSKIQFLKANHNKKCRSTHHIGLFINVKDTIFESKSQRRNKRRNANGVVYQCQRYNFWKQITTWCVACIYAFLLFINVKDTIFESKSQLSVKPHNTIYCCLSMSKIQFLKANHNVVCGLYICVPLFINVKDTIFESKSQLCFLPYRQPKCCLSMSKIQFLKANHNTLPLSMLPTSVVYQCQRYNFWKQITTKTPLCSGL